MTILQPGQMLGPYQITSQIGKGGMATVYKAYQVAMDRYVALKVVAGQLTDDPSFMQRFRQEARMIARLEHPHILPVYDFGEADGVPYMVMRFLEAGTLTERLDVGQLSLPEIDRIFSQLTEALEYAHENGVIHRDIKPSNAMLDKRGDVFLTDFGIAKMMEGTSGLTATGAITGTPSYMSPEQAQGNKVDQRSDIYSLGIVLFEMLTGRVPFEAETPMAVLFKQIQDPPPPLSLVRPDLPYTLEAVLLKALTKNSAARYASMGDFRAGWKSALTEAANLPSAIATPPSASINADEEAVRFPTPAPQAQVSARDETPILPAAGTVPPATTPAKKGFNGKALFAVGIPICLVVLCLSLGYVFRRQIFIRFLQMQAASRPTETARAADGTTPSAPVGETPSVSGKARSWASANSVYSIDFRGDEVLASGFGGVTIWNRTDDSYKQITAVDGLPSANAGLVFVDRDGAMWVGTDEGLAYINGSLHLLYTTDQGLDSKYVTVLAHSSKWLFAGTQYGGEGGGLLVLNGEKWQRVDGFPSKESPDEQSVSSSVRQLATDQDGNLWVATESGIAMLDLNNQWSVFKTGLPDNNVYTVYVDSTGTIWAGTANGGVAKFNPEKRAFESFYDLKDSNIYDVTSILEDRNGNLWFVHGYAARYNPKTNEWKLFNADQGDLPFYVSAIGMDDLGVLYFGSEGSGLARYKDDKFDVLLVPNAPHFGQYGRIIPTPDGKLIFVQLYDGGADEYDPADQSWTKLPSDRNIPRAFDAQGRMWSGGSDGLWIFDPAKTTQVTTALGLPSNQVNGIAFGTDGTAYIATDAGIAVFDGLDVKDVYTAAKNGLVSDRVYKLFMASDESLWASGDGGFNRRLPDGTWEPFTAKELFDGSSEYFPAFVEDRSGNIAVATLGDGLYIFSNGKSKRLRATDPGVGLPSDYLLSATLAPDGALWFGTDGQGAVRYDGKTQTWQRYGAAEGLPNQTINGIYVEPGGAVWFTTNGGVTRLEP